MKIHDAMSRYHVLAAFFFLFCAASCTEPELEPIPQVSNEYIAASVSVNRIVGSGSGQKINLKWEDGTTVWFGSNEGSPESCTIRSGEIGEDGSSVTLHYNNQPANAKEIYSTVVGNHSESKISGNSVSFIPSYDGTLSDACFLTARTSAGSGNLSFKSAPLIEFSIKSQKIDKFVVTIDDDVCPEIMEYDLSSGSLSAQSFTHEIRLPGGSQYYYLPVIEGAEISGFTFFFYEKSGNLLAKNEVPYGRALFSGHALSLGNVDNVPDDKEEPDDDTPDPKGLFDYSIIASAGHPRLITDANGFAELRRKISEGKEDDILLRKAHECVMYYADYYTNTMQKDIRYEFDSQGKSILDQSQSALLQLSTMSYAYNLTGDKRYLNRAKEILFQVCSFKDWNHSNFLDVAEMTLGVAIAYDWLYNSLTLEEKTLIHSRIVDYALSPSYRDDYIRTQNNWNQVCAAGMIAGALAIYEKDKAISANIIERNIAGNIEMASKIYAPDGNYGEGYSYWRYGTGFQVIMMEMLRTLFGNCGGMESIEGLDKTAEYMLFMDGVTGSFGYSDGGITSHGAKTAMWWFAMQQNDPSLVSKEITLLLNSRLYTFGSEPRMMFLVPIVLNKYHIDNKVLQTHAKDLWSGRGSQPVVMVHTGWKWDDTDHYLGIKAGVASGGHCHMDNGSFVYDALGVRWSTDLGKYNYSDMNNAFKAAGGIGSGQTSLRWDVLKMNNYGHSTISINAFDGSFSKRYPSDHNYSGTVSVTSVIETASELGATLDMSKALLGQVASAVRTIKLVNERDLVVIDVITAKDNLDAPILWHMITPASVEVKADHEVLLNGNKKMYLSATADKPVEITYKGTKYVRPAYFTPRVWDDEEDVRIAGFECTIPAGQTVTLTTILSPSFKD